MTAVTTYGPLVGRILLGLLFIVAGAGKLGNVDGLTGYLASGGLPGFLAWPTIIFELALGLAMVVGFQARIFGLAGAAFCVLAGFLFHFDLADPNQMTQVLKNLAIAGGFLYVAAHGAGRPAFDKA